MDGNVASSQVCIRVPELLTLSLRGRWWVIRRPSGQNIGTTCKSFGNLVLTFATTLFYGRLEGSMDVRHSVKRECRPIPAHRHHRLKKACAMENLCCNAVVVFQNGAKPFAALDFTTVRADFLGWLDQLVVQRLMVPLAKHSTSQ